MTINSMEGKWSEGVAEAEFPFHREWNFPSISSVSHAAIGLGYK
jgi:hypothetical protein